MNSKASTRGRRVTKYAQVAAGVRAQIEDGALLPGGLAPSGAELARQTGYSVLTCRRALRTLIEDGVLASGTSPGARPRVPARNLSREDRNLEAVKRALSASLAARRRAVCLTQPQLAEMVGRSVTTIGHAETGRVWQSRPFWERADQAVSAGGELLLLYDAYLAATVSARPADDGEAETIAVAASERTRSVCITWADGAVTTVYPSRSPLPLDLETGRRRKTENQTRT